MDVTCNISILPCPPLPSNTATRYAIINLPSESEPMMTSAATTQLRSSQQQRRFPLGNMCSSSSSSVANTAQNDTSGMFSVFWLLLPPDHY